VFLGDRATGHHGRTEQLFRPNDKPQMRARKKA
jgi:hypothetical protein